jgi:hypothetical protein
LTIVVLLILAIVWAAVLVPPWLRNRADARPADSITAFRHRLRVLERTGPPGSVQRTGFASSFRSPTGPVAPAAYRHRPADPTPAYSAHSARVRTQRRRRDIFVGMLAAMGTSLVLGFIPALRILWVVHLLVDGLFVSYMALLVHVRNQAAEKEMKVHFLPGRSADPAPLLLRRSAQ